jgi:hypothetical protein
LARIILSHALLESIRFVMSRKECRYIYGLINSVGLLFYSAGNRSKTLHILGM